MATLLNTTNTEENGVEYLGWTSRATINIESIDDTGKSIAKNESSIPSPFARIFLFDTAFSEVNRLRNSGINKETKYHILVSHCLDAIEIVYRLNLYLEEGKPIRIINYSFKNELEKLEKSQMNAGSNGYKDIEDHTFLAKTIKLFLNQSDKGYHKFDTLEDLSILLYNDKPLLANSPFTLFFTAPEPHKIMQDFKNPQGHVYFSNIVCPLMKRGDDFKKYLAYVRQRDEDWGFLFKNDGKVNNLGTYIDEELKDFSKDFGNIDYVTLDTIHFGQPWLAAPVPKMAEIEQAFMIMPTNKNPKKYAAVGAEPMLPLILPHGSNIFDTSWGYGTGHWVHGTIVPYKPGNLVENRQLPGTNTKMPWLTASDFFEPTLFNLPYNINPDKFFTCGAEKFPYLIPVKPIYFDFFSQESLKEHLSFRQLNTKEVLFTLELPIKGGKNGAKVKLEQKYSTDANRPEEIGYIKELVVEMAFFPLYRIVDETKSLYYVELLSKKGDFAELKFAIGNAELHGNYVNPFSEDIDAIKIKRTNYEINSQFDYVLVKNGGNHNMILPKWEKIEQKNLHSGAIVAIDFGTSSTHLVYAIGEGAVKEFNTGEQNMQVVRLCVGGSNALDIATKYNDNWGENIAFAATFMEDAKGLMHKRFMPSIIGREYQSKFKFPITTALFENEKNLQEHILFKNANIGLNIYQENKIDNYCTELKWSNIANTTNSTASNRIKTFFKQLLLMVKHQLVLDGADPQKARLLWLYPLSLQYKSGLQEIWKKTLMDIFSIKDIKTNFQLDDDEFAYADTIRASNLIVLNESVAPIYGRNIILVDDKNAVNIDIGGGSTDITFFALDKNEQIVPKASTSIIFAGNNLWGDGYKNQDQQEAGSNGFLTLARNLLSQKRHDTTRINDNSASSQDIINWLFAHDNVFHFTKQLKDNGKMKTVLLLHYGAIIYHLAQLINQENSGLKVPSYISFSGRGSAYLSIMGNEDMIGVFTARLLNILCKEDRKNEKKYIRIEKFGESGDMKKITAEGAVKAVQRINEELRPKNIFHVGTSDEIVVESLKAKQKIHVKDITPDVKDAVMKNVQYFLNLFVSTGDLRSFIHDKMGIPIKESVITDILKGFANGDIINEGLTKGIEILKRNNNDEDLLSDSLFFYPLKHILYILAKELVNK